MTRFGRTVLGGLLGALFLLSGGGPGDVSADTFNFEGIEIEEDAQQAVLAMDVPSDGQVEPSNRPARGEMTLTFRDVSVNVPRRVHRGEDGGLLKTVDIEPWFLDGQRLTRLVLRYEPGSVATYRREGDIVVVTVEPSTGDAPVTETTSAQTVMATSENTPDAEMPTETPTMTEAPTAAVAAAAVAVAATSASIESDEGASTDEPVAEEAMSSDMAPTDETETPADASDDELTWEVESQSESMWATEQTIPDESTAGALGNAPSSPDHPVDTSPDVPTEALAARSSTPPAQTMTPVADATPIVVAIPVDEAATAQAWTAPPPDTQPDTPTVVEIGPSISIDLQGADIQTVLRSIADTAGKNIVANADVRGTVTLALRDTPWRRALEIILRTQGLGYVEELGVIRVASADELRQDEISRQTAARKKEELIPLSTSVLAVQFAAARELIDPISGRLSQRGIVNVDERTNSIIITDIPANIPAVSELIMRLDTRTPQVEIVAKLVDLDVGMLRELGVQWGLSNLHSTKYGASANATVAQLPAERAGTFNFGIIQSWADLDVTLTALEESNQANIISNPKITTVNNREASILVGQEVPLNVQDEAGNTITELKKIGIGLRVTPYINAGDLITMDVRPQVSDLASQSSAQTGVIINNSEADTRVMVRDGETAVIGGLIRSNETVIATGVPILKDLPLIGALFKSEARGKAKRELVIFITPRIIQ